MYVLAQHRLALPPSFRYVSVAAISSTLRRFHEMISMPAPPLICQSAMLYLCCRRLILLMLAAFLSFDGFSRRLLPL